MKTMKRIAGSVNDVRIAVVNGRAVAVVMRTKDGYVVDSLYSKEEKQYKQYTEAREAALNAPAV